MRVKQYVVETMPEAMLQIRKDLGSDAVILSTKEIKVGGVLDVSQKRIEVVAAVDKEQSNQVKALLLRWHKIHLRPCLVRLYPKLMLKLLVRL